ncbi:MAG: hypothetical protein K0R54_1537 [Clostridiaceae bacterium]|jgi:hypothetical protein|nr:hypothetical protein [Clostridiaceae bacterium]
MKENDCSKKCDNNSKIESDKKQKKISSIISNQISIKMCDYMLF